MKCDIIIPVWNQLDYTKQCLESITRRTQYSFRLIIIDNGSGNETRQYLENLKQNKDVDYILVRNEENLGWVKAVNQGLKISTSPYACIMNNDTEVSEGWLTEMVKIAEKDKSIGLVNPCWDKPEGISVEVYAKNLSRYSGQYIEVDWCRGFCILIKREVIQKTGFLDEIYGLGYFDDRDYSVRAIKDGFICVKAKGAFVYHKRNVTVTKRMEEGEWRKLYDANRRIFYERCGKPLRLVFIFGRNFFQNGTVRQTENLWRSLLRDQHLVYAWSKKTALNLEHTNIYFKPLLFNGLAYFRIWDNLNRNPYKKYDAVFTGSEKMARFLSAWFGRKINIFSLEKSDNIVKEVAEKLENLKKNVNF